MYGPSARVAGLGFPDRRRLHQAMEWSGSTPRSPYKVSSLHAGTGSSCSCRRWFAGGDSAGRLAAGLGARAAVVRLADAANTVQWLHTENAAADFGHAEAPWMGVLQMRKRRGTCTCGSSFDSSFFSSIAVVHFELAHYFV